MSELNAIYRSDNRVVVKGDLTVGDARRVLSCMHQALEHRGYQSVVLDFSMCTSAFSAAMLPVCANACRLENKGNTVELVLPADVSLARLFINTGWAHLIDPGRYLEPDRRPQSRQFPVARYKTHEEQSDVLDELLEKLLSVVPNFNRSAFSAVEWALNEISDNVINHSKSDIGGLVQLSIFDPRRSRIEFTVSDAGVGVPTTLRSSVAQLNTDADALIESVRSGVTRNASDFQGNGLYGTLEICRVGGGKFSLNSGHAALYTQQQSLVTRNEVVPFVGTTVDALIDFSEPSLLEKALAIDGKIHRPTDYIELKYERDDGGAIQFVLEEQATSYRSRIAGKPLRTKLANLISSCPGQLINVDFAGIFVVSSSFADEVFGKLFTELGPMRFMQAVRLVNVSPTVQALIDRAITQRMAHAAQTNVGTVLG